MEYFQFSQKHISYEKVGKLIIKIIFDNFMHQLSTECWIKEASMVFMNLSFIYFRAVID
jgi:hypothetical protein